MPELKWFDELPTTWDESHVLSGSPGESIVMARRKGADWFVAAMTNTEGRTVSIPTDFLEKGKYTVTIYNDDPAADTKTKVGVSTQTITVKSKSKTRNAKGASRKPIVLTLQPSGGAVLRFTLQNK